MKLLSQRLTDRQLIQRGDLTLAFRARDSVLDRPVFVKCLNPALAQDAEIRARFEREAKAVARLDHPNLVRIYEYGEDPEEGLYMLLEWLDGTTLGALIRDGERFEGEAFTDLATQLLRGLSALHGVGILHRDLKPENILVANYPPTVTPHAGASRYKITDFSLAALRDAPRLTHHEAIVGTPAYMSPEQAMGGAPDERSDLFSLGAVLYEAASGENPFEARTMLETLRNVRELEPTFKHPAIVALPERARELLQKLLQKEPADRPESADEARRMLGEREVKAVAPERVAVAPSRRLYRLLPLIGIMLAVWVMKTWFHVESQWLNYLLLAVVVIGFFIGRSPFRNLKPEMLRPRSRKRDLKYLAAAILVIAFWGGMMLWFPWRGDSGRSELRNPEPGLNSSPGGAQPLDTASTPPNGGGTQEQRHDSNPQVAPPSTTPSEPEFRAAPEKPEKKSDAERLKDEAVKPASSVANISAMPSNPPDSVELTLNTEPWAQVYLNGTQLGTTPLGGAIRVPGGRQTLVLRNPAFPPVQVAMNFSEPVMRADVRLAEHTALVRVNVEPWGELYLDGEHIGTTPLPRPLFVSPGHHSVRVSHPELTTVQKEFQTAAGETLAVNVDLAHGSAIVKK